MQKLRSTRSRPGRSQCMTCRAADRSTNGLRHNWLQHNGTVLSHCLECTLAHKYTYTYTQQSSTLVTTLFVHRVRGIGGGASSVGDSCQGDWGMTHVRGIGEGHVQLVTHDRGIVGGARSVGDS